MKWTKYRIKTTTEAAELVIAMLVENGIDGVEIEDNVGITEEDKKRMFIDFLPVLPIDEGVSYVSFYVEDNGQNDAELLKHADWVEEFLPKYENITKDNVDDILKKEVGLVFERVLEDAGVYKCTEEGREAFGRFLASVGFKEGR